MKKFYAQKKGKIFYSKCTSDILCRVFILILCLFPRIILGLQSYPLRTRHDELATISAGAYFAGFDWSEVVSNASYYGTGFTVFFSVIFRLTDNPILIYRSMICICSLLQALCGLICFSILKNIFHIRNKIYLIVCSVMCSFVVVTRANVVYNEHMIIFLTWLSVYCLIYINLSEEKRKRCFASVLLAVLLSYAYTVHIRGIVFCLAVVVMILFFYIYKRIRLVDIKCFAISGAIGMLISKNYISWIQKVLWRVKDGEALANSHIPVMDKIAFLKEWNSWKAIFYTIVGQLNTISMVSAGIIIIMLGCATILFWKGKGRYQKRDRMLIIMQIILLYCILCMCLTIAGQSITWLPQTKSVIDYGYGNNLYGTKAFTYIRYFGPYCGPLVMMFAVFLYKFYKEMKKIVTIMFPILILLQAIWLFLIMPYMAGTTQTGGLEAFLCFLREDVRGRFDYNFFYAVSLISMLIYFINLFLIRRKGKFLLVFLLSFFLIYQYGYNAKNWDIVTQYNNYSAVDDAYKMIDMLEEELVDIPEQIYVIPEERDNLHYWYYVYQMMLNRYHIVPEYPDDKEDVVIVFSAEELSGMELKGFVEIQLDTYEYMYIKGDKLIQQVNELVEEKIWQ